MFDLPDLPLAEGSEVFQMEDGQTGAAAFVPAANCIRLISTPTALCTERAFLGKDHLEHK